MAKIEKVGSSYEYEDENDSFTISFLLPDIIAMYGRSIQFFKNPQNLGIGGCLEAFKDINIIIQSATIHTEGKINKKKLIQSVQKAQISDSYKKTLLEYIGVLSPNMSPETFRRQLIIRGLDSALPYLEFEEHSEELLDTCNLFKKFLDEYKKQKTRR